MERALWIQVLPPGPGKVSQFFFGFDRSSSVAGENGRNLVQREGLAQLRGSTKGRNAMQASAWKGGSTAAPVFGIRVGNFNRDEFFRVGWEEIEVEVEGQDQTFRLTPGFWRKCPEFRDCGSRVIREWLRRHHTLNWPKGLPPQVQLIPLGGRRVSAIVQLRVWFSPARVGPDPDGELPESGQKNQCGKRKPRDGSRQQSAKAMAEQTPDGRGKTGSGAVPWALHAATAHLKTCKPEVPILNLGVGSA